MSEFFYDHDGGIAGGIPFPHFLYEKLTEDELAQVRRYVHNRFAMGYWHRGQQEEA